MKASLRDHLTILMAFAAVFLCGYGISNLVWRTRPPAAPVSPSWSMANLASLREALNLDPKKSPIVEEELLRTEERIDAARSAALLAYHEHLLELYDRLIERLGEPEASRLATEKMQLELAIQKLKNPNNSSSENQ